jgi:hypothetical protein
MEISLNTTGRTHQEVWLDGTLIGSVLTWSAGPGKPPQYEARTADSTPIRLGPNGPDQVMYYATSAEAAGAVLMAYGQGFAHVTPGWFKKG